MLYLQAAAAAIDAVLADLEKKHGTKPNIIHIMWDDTAFGDIGIPAIQKVRGLETPHLNTMAALAVALKLAKSATVGRSSAMKAPSPLSSRMKTGAGNHSRAISAWMSNRFSAVTSRS